MACVRECPGHAISATKTVKVTLAGHELEWGELDCQACCIGLRGGKVRTEDWERVYIEDDWSGKPIAPSEVSPFYRKPRKLYNTGEAICGSRGCMRACMISLEARGILENKFHAPFRRRKPWLIDWTDEPERP